MRGKSGTWILWGIILIIIVGGGVWVFKKYVGVPANSGPGTLVGNADYACDASRGVSAAYYEGPAKAAVSPDAPPTPGGSVMLGWSDGRMETLPQTISADGSRYANADESLVFWDKGNTAMVNEAGKSYTCIEIVADPGGLPERYGSGTRGFSARYPANYTADDSYTYAAQKPHENIPGVKFTIDSLIATSTNLSTDSYVSVEEIPLGAMGECSAVSFLREDAKEHTLTEGDITYSLANATDAAAGNRYEETVYAFPGEHACFGIRYFVHYGAIQNYPAGAVKEFDREALRAQFDAIRKSVTIAS